VQQVSDMHDAVTFAKTLKPRIDDTKICVWGIGHSGGMGIMATALDPRVAAAIIVMPFTSGSNDKAIFPMERVWAERENQSGETEYQKIWPDSKAEALSDPPTTLLNGLDAWEFIDAARDMTKKARGEGMPNQLSLQSFYHIGSVDPMNFIHLIAPRPLLYLAAETDTLTGPVEWHREVFARAGKPSEFVLLKDHHLATYVGETFETNVAKQIDFLKRHL
jgi:hypothetical protein